MSRPFTRTRGHAPSRRRPRTSRALITGLACLGVCAGLAWGEPARAAEPPAAATATTTAAATTAAVALTIDAAAQRAADLSPIARRARAERGTVAARQVEADFYLPANPNVAA